MRLPKQFSLLMFAVTVVAVGTFYVKCYVDYYADSNCWRRTVESTYLHRVLRAQVRNGDSWDKVTSLLTAELAQPVSIAGRVGEQSKPGFPVQAYPDGFRRTDTLVCYVTSEGGCVYLQFRDKKLVNHNPNWYIASQSTEPLMTD